MALKLKLTGNDIEEHAQDADTLALLCGLATGDSLSIFSEEERQRREAEALADFDAGIQPHDEFVDEITADAQAELDLIEDIDPRGLDELDDADVAVVVSTWLPIAERDIEHMPSDDLERRCRSLIGIGDRRRLSAYAIALRARLSDLQREYADRPLNGVPASITAERVRLGGLSAALEAALVDPKRAERKKVAEAQLDRARTLRKRIEDAKAKAHRQRERDMAAAAARFGGSL